MYPESSCWVQTPRREARQILFGVTALKFVSGHNEISAVNRLQPPVRNHFLFPEREDCGGGGVRLRANQSWRWLAGTTHWRTVEPQDFFYHTEPWRVNKILRVERKGLLLPIAGFIKNCLKLVILLSQCPVHFNRIILFQLYLLVAAPKMLFASLSISK